MNDRWLGHRPLRLIREFSRPLTDPKWRTKRGFKKRMFDQQLIVYALYWRTQEYTVDKVPHTYAPRERITLDGVQYEVVERYSVYIKLRNPQETRTFPIYRDYLLHNGTLCLKEMIVYDLVNWKAAGPLPFLNFLKG